SNCVIANCAAYGGGGIWNGTVYDTFLTKNSAIFGGGSAGGTTFYNCLFVTSYTFAGGYGSGGGADGGTLYNCILSNNVSDSGGGAANCALSNCTIVANTATGGGGRAGGVRGAQECQMDRKRRGGWRWGEWGDDDELRPVGKLGAIGRRRESKRVIQL